VAYSKTKVPRNRNQLLNHHPPTSQLTTTAHKPTNRADRTATPANTSTTSPQRQSAKIAQSSRHESPEPAPSPAPATGDGAPGRTRKLFPPQAPAFAPLWRSTSKTPHQPRLRDDAQNRQLLPPQAPASAPNAVFDFQSAPPATTMLQRRKPPALRLKALLFNVRLDLPSGNLTEQGGNKHCTVFLKALTTRLHLRGGCGIEPLFPRKRPLRVCALITTAPAASGASRC
jgi:hypothetical protein